MRKAGLMIVFTAGLLSIGMGAVAPGAAGTTGSAFSVPSALPTPARFTGVGSTPDAVLREVYKVHGEDFKENRDRILNEKSRKYLDKYFDKNLSGLIWKDLTSNSDEVGVLDFDLFYNAQDAQIRNLTVGRPTIQGDRSTVPVSFNNFGQKETLVYTLVRENGSWKIADIKYKTGDTLLKYFKENS
jgi:hypothetical protein